MEHLDLDPLHGVLGLDVETVSACDIGLGAWAYSMHASTRVWCAVLVYLDTRTGRRTQLDLTRRGFLPGVAALDDLPAKVGRFLTEGGQLVAHNASFEDSIWRNVLTPVHGWPELPDDGCPWIDTQVLGMAVNLPPTLDGLCAALGTPVQKDAEGAKVMKSLASASFDRVTGLYTYPTPSPVQAHALLDYCADDVHAMLDAFDRLPPLSMAEELVRRADWKVNRRGVALDWNFADKLRHLATERLAALEQEADRMTGGRVDSLTDPGCIKSYLVECGVPLPKRVRKKKDGTTTTSVSADKRAIASLVERADVADDVRRLLLLRTEAAKTTSLAKLERVEPMTPGDGRLRHALRYCGAHTGRWSSSGLQLHNLAKNKLGAAASRLAEAAVHAGDLDALEYLQVDPVLSVLSQQLRSVVVAAPGHDLIAADYSAIEARVLAWLAGEESVLDIFRAGRDIYVADAAAAGSTDRQLGKVSRLALGYGMGTAKFADTGVGYGITMPMREWHRLRVAWRENNPAIVAFWRTLEEAAKSAVMNPGQVFAAGRVRACCAPSGHRLDLLLPSGRPVVYWRPSISEQKRVRRWYDAETDRMTERETVDHVLGFWKPGGRAMAREETYGGKLAENVTQALARDLLGHSLTVLDRHGGYPVVIHVHDSAAAEVPEGTGSVAEFEYLMTETPAWADGCPIAVEGYRAKRFAG